MKKVVFGCLAALGLAASVPGSASAWCKFNFGVGANINYESGGDKSFLWGMCRSWDYPHAESSHSSTLPFAHQADCHGYSYSSPPPGYGMAPAGPPSGGPVGVAGEGYGAGAFSYGGSDFNPVPHGLPGQPYGGPSGAPPAYQAPSYQAPTFQGPAPSLKPAADYYYGQSAPIPVGYYGNGYWYGN